MGSIPTASTMTQHLCTGKFVGRTGRQLRVWRDGDARSCASCAKPTPKAKRLGES